MAFKQSGTRRWRRWAAAVAATATLAACGGGDTVVPFDPDRLVAFGDELSLLLPDGRKYTVNAVTSATATPPLALDCKTHPLWVQRMAVSLGMAFAQCPQDSLPLTAHTRATAGAKVADVEAAAQAFLANDAPKDQDLVTVLAGMHDILEAYAAFKSGAGTEQALRDELRARGERLAEVVNRVARAGPAVIVSTVPDLGKTPLAVAAGAADAEVLSALTVAFNSGLRVNMVQDGRLVGIIFGEALIQNSVRFAASYGYGDGNVREAACPASAPLPDCGTDDLATGVTATRWLWADATHPGPTFHEQLGDQALQRARNNPF